MNVIHIFIQALEDCGSLAPHEIISTCRATPPLRIARLLNPLPPFIPWPPSPSLSLYVTWPVMTQSDLQRRSQVCECVACAEFSLLPKHTDADDFTRRGSLTSSAARLEWKHAYAGATPAGVRRRRPCWIWEFILGEKWNEGAVGGVVYIPRTKAQIISSFRETNEADFCRE